MLSWVRLSLLVVAPFLGVQEEPAGRFELPPPVLEAGEQLRQGDFQNPLEAQAQLARYAESYSTVKAGEPARGGFARGSCEERTWRPFPRGCR